MPAQGRTNLPQYLAYAKKPLGMSCVLGEYTGHVRLETTVQVRRKNSVLWIVTSPNLNVHTRYRETLLHIESF